MSPTPSTLKRLFAHSANRCSFPECTTTLTHGDILVGEVCHIKGERPGSARHDPNQSDTERHAYENLIILCPTHHKLIDYDKESFSVAQLNEMKSKHEAAAGLLADDKADDLALTYFNANYSNIGQTGGVAAQNFRADTFTINHHRPADPFSQQRSAAAVASVWKAIMGIRNEFGVYVYIDTILTREEIAQSYENGWKKPLTYLNAFSDYAASQELLTQAGAFETDVEKPFVSKEAWAAFHAIRGAYGRYGFLLCRASSSHHYEEWQDDELLCKTLCSVLPSGTVDGILKQQCGGFSSAITHLEEEFLRHAGFRPK